MDPQEQARTYHRWQFRLGAASLLLALGYLVALLLTGIAIGLEAWLATVIGAWWLELPAALLVLGGAYQLLHLPLGWARGFWLPRRFGLLHQPLARWLRDAAKAALLNAGLALLGAEIVYGLLRATPWWWLWSAAVFFVGHALLAYAAPVLLVPLFFRLAPLGEGELRERLLGLARRAGVPVLGVWVADQSRKSRTANAAVTGLWRTRRVLLFDTLLREFTPDEIEVVLAHELAHHVHGDIRRGLAAQAGLTLATFWAADGALRAGARWLGLDGPADLGGLPLFGLILLAAGLAALPLANGWSRRVERQADDFALRLASNPRAFVAAMERLGRLNLAELEPHPLKEFFLYSHPSIGRRLSRAREALAGRP